MRSDHISERTLCKIEVNVPAGKGRVGDDPSQGTFQFTDIGTYTLTHKKGYFTRQFGIELEGLALQDSYAGLEVRWFDRDAYRLLQSGLVTVALAVADPGEERRRVARMSDTLTAVEERSEYRLDQLFLA